MKLVRCHFFKVAYNLKIESMLIHPTKWGIETKNKNKMKNMNTTLEIPEGSKATIQGKVIDGKNYIVVEMEQEPELKAGDFAIFWNDNTEDAIISVCKRLDDKGRYVDHLGLCWDNALKWDGTKEQFERVLRGELHIK